jgi:hypothetical protein
MLTLEIIARREPVVRAFAHLDPALVRRQAAAVDAGLSLDLADFYAAQRYAPGGRPDVRACLAIRGAVDPSDLMRWLVLMRVRIELNDAGLSVAAAAQPVTRFLLGEPVLSDNGAEG